MRAVNGDTLCKGESMRLSASGAHRYSWTPAEGLDNPNAASPMATPMKTTNYRVVGTDDKNCFTDTSYIPLVVYGIPTVDAGADKSINVGKTIEITPKVSADVIDAKWSPSGQAFRSNFPNLTIMPRETTTYRVDVFNQGGCTSFDEITINVLCDGANLFIPNTFSPNSDGMNDIFYPRGTGLFSIKSLKIFTRWGEVIFEKNNFRANDAGKGWDGTFKGTKLNSDVFVYIAEVLCDNNSVLTFKGNVALIR
jgi:gliding motility-associated-like protein